MQVGLNPESSDLLGVLANCIKTAETRVQFCHSGLDPESSG